MFKNHNRTYLVLCMLLIGMFSSVFAVDFSQVLDQMKTDVFSMGDLFEGKPVVANIYLKSLKLAKDVEVTATTTSFDGLKIYYSTCSTVTNTDFINVLYNSNTSFRETFNQILPKGTKKPVTKQIDQSYAKFFRCKNIASPNLDDIQAFNNEINKIYYDGYSNAYALSTLNQDNFGSDLFWNGTLDDSSFDLLYDINQVSKILFEDVQESPQVLLYRLPTLQQASTQNGGDLSSLSDQSSYQLGNGGGSFPGTVGGGSEGGGSSSGGGMLGDGGSLNGGSFGGGTNGSSGPSEGDPNDIITNDGEVQTFIETTNSTSVSSVTSTALLLGNQCLVSDTPVTITGEETVYVDSVTYVSGLVDFINNANINDVVNNTLLAQFTAKNPLPLGKNTSDTGYSNAVANTYAEQAFGESAPGSACSGLPLDQQVQCEFEAASSCIQQCDGLGIQQKALCISDCTCFLIAGPNGPGREKVEDMYRIKFCKVPVQKKTLSPGKKVYSIQAIFQEISDVLEGLRDSGKMVKFSKTKEFLDTNAKINFADNFAFKLQVGLKPVFTQKSTTISAKEETQANTDLNLGILDINVTAPEADDYNKYIVISDPIKNKASLEYATSLEEVNQNIAQVAGATNNVTKLTDDTVESIKKMYSSSVNISFIQNLIVFLQSNQMFRNDLSTALLDMNQMSLELKTRIEDSK